MYDVSEGFRAYKIYLALKQHFTSDYDFFKYKGKVRANEESFLRRNDKFFFRKLSKKYNNNELIEFFVSNFIVSDNWIGNLISQESEENYIKWRKFHEALSYNIYDELRICADYCSAHGMEANKLLLVEDGNHPILLKFLLQKKISLETIIILNDILKFFQYWDIKLNDIMWDEKRKLIFKYKKFFTYDPFEMRRTIKKLFI